MPLIYARLLPVIKSDTMEWRMAEGEISFWYKSGTNEKAAITFVITALFSEPPIGIEPMTY